MLKGGVLCELVDTGQMVCICVSLAMTDKLSPEYLMCVGVCVCVFVCVNVCLFVYKHKVIESSVLMNDFYTHAAAHDSRVFILIERRNEKANAVATATATAATVTVTTKTTTDFIDGIRQLNHSTFIIFMYYYLIVLTFVKRICFQHDPRILL